MNDRSSVHVNVVHTVLSVALKRQLTDFVLDLAFSTSALRTVLFGPSGAGKSLTLQALAGLLPLEQGHITCRDQIWYDSSARHFVPPQERGIGYLPQQYALFPHLNVAQNIAFGQRARGRSARARVQELIHLMQLEGLERVRPAQLSGGQQQRVALARALATEPELLLLDEPWSALDGPVRASLRAEILRFHEQFGVPLLLVTHDTLDVQMLAEYVVVIAQGCVLQMGTPEQIFRTPQTREVARLVGVESCLRGTLLTLEHSSEGQRATIKIQDGILSASLAADCELFVGQEIEFALHTDEIIVMPTSETTQRTGYIPGIVAGEQARGAFHILTIDLFSQTHLEIPIPRWQRRELALEPGTSVLLSIPAEAVHIFPLQKEPTL